MLAMYLTLAFMVLVTAADIVFVRSARRLQADHQAALARMRTEIRVYDAICRSGGDAEHLFVRHRQGTDSTWTDIVLSVPGLSLRMPIRPEEMDRFIAELRDQS